MKTRLLEIHKQLSGDLALVKDFAVLAEKSLEFPPKLDAGQFNLNGEDRAELKRVSEELSALLDKGQKGHPRLSVTVKSEGAGNFIFALVRPLKQRHMVAEMATVYVVSKFESFIKDLLLVIFQSKPEMLKSGKVITHEDALSHSSRRSLVATLAEKEVESIGYGSVDDLQEYLQKKLSINISEHKAWEIVREASYRRNLIVHNGGKQNQIYAKKKCAKERSAIPMSFTYLESIVVALIDIASYIHLGTTNKLSGRSGKSNKALKPTAALDPIK